MPFLPKAKSKGTEEKKSAVLTVTLKWMADNEAQVKEAEIVRSYAQQSKLKPTAYVYGCLNHALNTGPLVDSASAFEEAVTDLNSARATKNKVSIEEAQEAYDEMVAYITETHSPELVSVLEQAFKIANK